MTEIGGLGVAMSEMLDVFQGDAGCQVMNSTNRSTGTTVKSIFQKWEHLIAAIASRRQVQSSAHVHRM